MTEDGDAKARIDKSFSPKNRPFIETALDHMEELMTEVVYDIDKTTRDRRKNHGDFREQAKVTQLVKDIMHASPNWFSLSYTQKEGLEMIVHKIGRILAGDPNHLDHWVDIEGYARITKERL